MKLWFIIGAILAIVLTACVTETPSEQNTEINNSDTANSENNESENDVLCCQAMTASCLACEQNITIPEFCDNNPNVAGCTADGPPTEDERNEELEEEFIEEIPDKNAIDNSRKTLSGVSCSEDTLTFTLTNRGSKTTVLDTLSFPSPQDKEQMVITINNYEPWTSDEYFFEQTLQECFSGNLEPGKSVTCSLSPIPTVTESAYSQNSILVQVPGVYAQQTFTCS